MTDNTLRGSTTPSLLRYRAGRSAIKLLRETGLQQSSIRAFVAPASGPKWLVLAGLDRALMAAALIPKWEARDTRDRLLMAGASAGAWRVMAMATGDAAQSHTKLEHAYVHHRFPRGVHRREITAAYRAMLEDLFPERRISETLEGLESTLPSI